MSIETLQLVKDMSLQALEVQLALQCAPVLAGIKPSNLLNISVKEIERVKGMFYDTAVKVYFLYHKNGMVSLLLYRQEALEEYLMQSMVQQILDVIGYPTTSMTEILQEFSIRYQNYKQLNGSFPHEMGLLMGYPPEDVWGFIQNKGQGAKYSGYWKVYGNLAKALHTFQQYEQAKEQAVRMIAKQQSVLSLLDGLPAAI